MNSIFSFSRRKGAEYWWSFLVSVLHRFNVSSSAIQKVSLLSGIFHFSNFFEFDCLWWAVVDFFKQFESLMARRISLLRSYFRLICENEAFCSGCDCRTTYLMIESTLLVATIFFFSVADFKQLVRHSDIFLKEKLHFSIYRLKDYVCFKWRLQYCS